MKRRVAIGGARRVYHFPPPPVSRLHLTCVFRTRLIVQEVPSWNYTGITWVLGGALAAGGGAIRSRRPSISRSGSARLRPMAFGAFCNYKTPAANLIRPLTWPACLHLIAFRVKVHRAEFISSLALTCARQWLIIYSGCCAENLISGSCIVMNLPLEICIPLLAIALSAACCCRSTFILRCI
jgi:hypothetical protein